MCGPYLRRERKNAFYFENLKISGPGISVSIATGYELDGPGIESWWGRDLPHVQTGPGTYPASCTMGTGYFPGIECGRGVTLTPHPLLVPWSKNRVVLYTTLLKGLRGV
jgi:hypothetical protein